MRSSISFEIVNDFTDCLDGNIELIYLKIKPHMQRRINLIAIYRPPDGKYKEFTRHLTGMLKQIDRSRSDTILIGDFNIDFNNKKLLQTSKLDILENQYALKQWAKH